jgi:hypothetical protein
MILSREDLAEKDFLTIINKMPLAELYDGCFWNLAEISLHNSEFTLALTRLDQILNVDESITPEIVQNRYNEILKLQKEKRNAISPDTNPTDPVNPDASSESPQMSLDETETNQSVEDQNAFPSLE